MQPTGNDYSSLGQLVDVPDSVEVPSSKFTPCDDLATLLHILV